MGRPGEVFAWGAACDGLGSRLEWGQPGRSVCGGAAGLVHGGWGASLGQCGVCGGVDVGGPVFGR